MTHPTVIFFFAPLPVFAGSRTGTGPLRMVDFGLFAVILEWPVFSLSRHWRPEAARAKRRSQRLKTLGESIGPPSHRRDRDGRGSSISRQVTRPCPSR